MVLRFLRTDYDEQAQVRHEDEDGELGRSSRDPLQKSTYSAGGYAPGRSALFEDSSANSVPR